MPLLFVYGTLLRGEPNHRLLSGARFVGHHATEAAYTMYDLGGYPGVVDEGETAIRGEVYGVNGRTLTVIDRLEEVPVEYLRGGIDTPYGAAWIYLYRGRRRGRVVRSGTWGGGRR